jgi:threonyl-tRNA synthetase
MKILQLDVEKLAYDVLKPEASVYEETKEKHAEFRDALVMWVCVEKGDTDDTADAALKDTVSFMEQVGRKKLVVYPFAHLSSDLAEPKEAMRILDHMYKGVPKNIEASKAPFGWTKKFTIEMKGHPLAEQAKSYDSKGGGKKTYKKAKPTGINTAIVKKSDWAGLPENDHRTIGEKLDLYSFQEVSPAMVYWHPKGFTIYKQLVAFLREKEDEYEYEEVSTPGLANVALWHMSGHDEHYKENMFTFESQFGEIGLKPMNCPSTIMIYKSRKWSYRDLPFRTAIFDRLYRSELSGAVTGLFRVKELTQDDGHIFVREDQIDKELDSLLRMVKEIYDTFGLKYAPKLSTMPDDHAGEKAEWDRATAQLKKALDEHKMKYELKEKEGSFYAPKIDFDIFDSQGRAWQVATIQLDYQMPKRFKLEYTGEDGKEHTPVMIHRAILGSLERFVGILVEHYQGKFPTWLAPVQVRVIAISDQSNEYAHKVYESLRKAHIRAEEDIGGKTMEYKLRDAIGQKIPYVLVVGKKEVDAGTVAVRTRSGGQKFGVKLDDFVGKIKVESEKRLASPN